MRDDFQSPDFIFAPLGAGPETAPAPASVAALQRMVADWWRLPADPEDADRLAGASGAVAVPGDAAPAPASDAAEVGTSGVSGAAAVAPVAAPAAPAAVDAAIAPDPDAAEPAGVAPQSGGVVAAATGPVLSVTGDTVLESSNNYLRFVVTLSEPSTGAVTFSYRTLVEGSASDADLYYPSTSSSNNSSVTLAPGATSAEVFIRVASDSLDEVHEAITLELHNLTGATFDNGETVLRATGVILDDDGSGPNQALFVSDPVMVEGDNGSKMAVFEVRLAEPAAATVTFSYRTADGSALAGEDYRATSGQLTFVAGQQVAEIEVEVFGDNVAEFGESFDLVVTPPDPVAISDDAAAGTATILDDDVAGGSILSIAGDTVAESSNNYLRFVVTLSQPSTGAVTFNYRTLVEGSAADADLYYPSTSSSNNGTVTLAPGQTSADIYIRVASDSLDEADEAMTLELFNLVGATFEDGETTQRATGVILDDDGSAPNLAILVSDPVLVEGDNGTKTALFEVRLSQPATSAVTLSYTTVDGSAVAGEDYRATAGKVTFAAGQQVAHVAVDVFGDNDPEFGESFDLVVSSPDPVAISDDAAAGTATILDEDASGGTILSIVGDSVAEDSNNYLRFVVTLTEPSTGAVSFSYRTLVDGSAADEDLYYPSTSSSNNGLVTLAPGQTSADIYIRVASDSVDESDEALTLELYNLLGATFENGEITMSATGIILDNDGSGPNLALLDQEVTVSEGAEQDATYSFTVHLSQPVTEATTFAVSLVGGSASVPQDIRLLTSQVTFLAGQTTASVSVEVEADTLAEGLEVAQLVFTPLSGMTPADVGFTTIYIENVSLFTTGDDDVDLGSESNNVDALAGDDTVAGRGGDDTIDGNSGNDVLDGGEGSDVLLGGDGADLLNGGRGPDTLNGGAGQDTLRGSEGNDVMSAGGGNDAVDGNAGSDLIDGDAGDDFIDGGQGADTVNGGDGNDAIDGREGFDNLSGDAGDDVLAGGAGSDVIDGGNEDDRIDGGQGADTLSGGSGNDTVEGKEGFDSLRGDGGNDLLSGNAGSDVIEGGGGNDTLEGGQGADTMSGDNGNDTLEGQSGGDVMDGGNGDDSVIGGDGRDRLDGGAGDDTLFGGRGADEFVYASGSDIVEDLSTGDTILLDGDALSLGGLSVNAILSGFGSSVGGDTVLDFGGGNVLTVAGYADPDALAGSLTII